MKVIQKILILLFDVVFITTLLKVISNFFYNHQSFTDFFKLALVFMIFLNSWTIEIVHLNRYNKNLGKNFLFIILQIAVYMNLLKKNDFSIKYLSATLILIAIIFSIQHITEYIITDEQDLILKKLTEPFCYIHTGRTLILMLGFIFIDYVYYFIFLAFLLSQLFPSFISRSLHALSLNFRELINNIEILLIVLCILLNYNFSIIISCIIILAIIFIELFIDKNVTRQTGNTFIIGTYFFIFGVIVLYFSLMLSNGIFYYFIFLFCIFIAYLSCRQYFKNKKSQM